MIPWNHVFGLSCHPLRRRLDRGHLDASHIATEFGYECTLSHSVCRHRLSGHRRPRGWVVVVPESDHRAVYLSNYGYVHDAPDVEILGELTESRPNAWEFAIAVTPRTSEKEGPEECQPRSRINAAIALPTDAESPTITIDGDLIAVVDTTSSTPRVSYLERRLTDDA